MALPTRRPGVLLQLLVIVLALTAAFISCSGAARAPAILRQEEEAAAPDQGQAPAMPLAVERVVVVDKRGGGGSVFGTGQHGHHDSSGKHKHHKHNSAPGGRDGVWRAAGLAATSAAAAAWFL
ncbi:unnamed protein product [Urochloa humidicola]